MADIKISALPVAASVVLADYIPCVIAAGPTTNRASLTVVRAAILPAAIATDVSGLGANVATFLATPTSSNLAAAVSDETGTGFLVFHTSPRFVTPTMWNPAVSFRYLHAGSAIVADRTVTWPLLTGNDTVVCEAMTQTLTNKTINGANNTLTARIANDVSGLGAGVATFLATPTTANFAAAVTGETGTGAVVFGTSPTLTTPQIDGGRAELDSFRVKGEVTNANTTSQNDIPRAAIIRCTGDGLIITGIEATGAEHGEQVELWFPLAFATGITITHQDAASAAANRIISWTGATINAFEQSVMILRYDATTQRWRFAKDGF